MARGGRRKGAGRPAGPPTLVVRMRLTAEEAEELRRRWGSVQEAVRSLLRGGEPESRGEVARSQVQQARCSQCERFDRRVKDCPGRRALTAAEIRNQERLKRRPV
jgi:hypothetical protein